MKRPRGCRKIRPGGNLAEATAASIVSSSSEVPGVGDLGPRAAIADAARVDRLTERALLDRAQQRLRARCRRSPDRCAGPRAGAARRRGWRPSRRRSARRSARARPRRSCSRPIARSKWRWRTTRGSLSGTARGRLATSSRWAASSASSCRTISSSPGGREHQHHRAAGRELARGRGPCRCGPGDRPRGGRRGRCPRRSRSRPRVGRRSGSGAGCRDQTRRGGPVARASPARRRCQGSRAASQACASTVSGMSAPSPSTRSRRRSSTRSRLGEPSSREQAHGHGEHVLGPRVHAAGARARGGQQRGRVGGPVQAIEQRPQPPHAQLQVHLGDAREPVDVVGDDQPEPARRSSSVRGSHRTSDSHASRSATTIAGVRPAISALVRSSPATHTSTFQRADEPSSARSSVLAQRRATGRGRGRSPARSRRDRRTRAGPRAGSAWSGPSPRARAPARAGSSRGPGCTTAVACSSARFGTSPRSGPACIRHSSPRCSSSSAWWVHGCCSPVRSSKISRTKGAMASGNSARAAGLGRAQLEGLELDARRAAARAASRSRASGARARILLLVLEVFVLLGLLLVGRRPPEHEQVKAEHPQQQPAGHPRARGREHAGVLGQAHAREQVQGTAQARRRPIQRESVGPPGAWSRPRPTGSTRAAMPRAGPPLGSLQRRPAPTPSRARSARAGPHQRPNDHVHDDRQRPGARPAAARPRPRAGRAASTRTIPTCAHLASGNHVGRASSEASSGSIAAAERVQQHTERARPRPRWVRGWRVGGGREPPADQADEQRDTSAIANSGSTTLAAPASRNSAIDGAELSLGLGEGVGDPSRAVGGRSRAARTRRDAGVAGPRSGSEGRRVRRRPASATARERGRRHLRWTARRLLDGARLRNDATADAAMPEAVTT